jgi:hypothetical protein
MNVGQNIQHLVILESHQEMSQDQNLVVQVLGHAANNK